MSAPTPDLAYHWSGNDAPSGEGIVDLGLVGDRPLARVFKASAWLDLGSGVELFVRGPMLRKDGTPSRRQVSLSVDLASAQPGWLSEVIGDAYARLLPVPAGGEETTA